MFEYFLLLRCCSGEPRESPKNCAVIIKAKKMRVRLYRETERDKQRDRETETERETERGRERD